MPDTEEQAGQQAEQEKERVADELGLSDEKQPREDVDKPTEDIGGP